MPFRRIDLLANAVKSAALLVVLVLATLSVLATRARSSLPANSLTDTATVTEPKAFVAAAPNAVPDDENKGFWLTLRASGFETKEMSISAGDYFVIIQNATGLDQFALRIERETGERIHDVRLPRLKKRWRQMINFTPGNYIVSEADHPTWTCRITVTPSQ